VSFFASWCAACAELDRTTFADPSVRRALAGCVSVRVDATDVDDPMVARLLATYQVVGLPTMVVVDPSGRQVARATEFVTAERLVTLLRDGDRASP
jgi:thiol:disulfide interchange protein DsbD